MGRRLLAKTKKERAAQKRRWDKARNDRRRDRYANDLEYREHIKEGARMSGRRTSPGGGLQRDRMQICIESLKTVAKAGQERFRIGADGKVTKRKLRTLTSTEMAPLIGLSHAVMLHKWQRAGKFPRPEVRVIVVKTHAEVYTIPQAKKLIRVMKDHYAIKSYLSDRDTEVISALQEAMLS